MRLSDVLINLGKPMAYYPNIGIACKSVNAGILVSQLGFWSDKGSHGDGWIYKSVEQLTEETGLSYKEQRSARRQLVKLGIIEEHYDRTNHRLFFRVNLERINEVWEEYIAEKDSTCPKGICSEVTSHLPKGHMPPAQRAVRTVPTKSTTENTTESTAPPPEKNNYLHPETIPNLESPLAKELLKVCKKHFMLSPNDRTKMQQALMILESQDATSEQMKSFGQKVQFHWCGKDKKTQHPAPPGIMQVAENWQAVLDIQLEANGEIAHAKPKLPIRAAHNDASLKRYIERKKERLANGQSF